MSDELDQNDNTDVEEEAIDPVEAAKEVVEAEEKQPEPQASDDATVETPGDQDAVEQPNEDADATPGTGQGSIDKSTEAEIQDALLAAVPPEFQEEITKLRQMQVNYNERDGLFQKEHQARLDAEKALGQYREVAEDPVKLAEEARTAREHNEKISQLPPWHAHHPYHQDFMGLVQRGRDVGQRVAKHQADASLEDETRNRLIRDEMANLSEQDRQHLAGYQQAVEQWNLNPMGSTMAAIDQGMQAVPNVVRQEVSRIMEEQSARQEVATLAQEHPEAIQKFAPDMQRVLQARSEADRFTIAKEVLDLKTSNEALEAKLAALTANLGEAAVTVAMSEAQIEATNTRAKRTPVARAAGPSGLTPEDLATALQNGSLLDVVSQASE